MAIGATCVWEFRPTATASMVNGGGFVAGGGGTDYSQQDAAQYQGTDLACAAGTTNPSVITSASHNFVAADVGNIIHITAGTSWLAGWYQIVSCAGNAATLDRAVGSAVTLTNGSFFVGGALNTGSATLDATWASPNALAGGNTVWFKKGTYTPGSAVTFKGGQATAQVTINGYNSSRGDNPTGTNRPTIDYGSFGMTSGIHNNISNIIFTSNTGTGFLANNGLCRFSNTKHINNGASAGNACLDFSSNNACTMINCEIISYRGKGITIGAISGVYIYGCYIHDCDVGISITSGTTGIIIQDCIIEGCVTQGINLSAATIGHSIYGCTIYGAETPIGTGINIANGASKHILLNNIIYGCVTGITDLAATTSTFIDYTNYFNCTTARGGTAMTGTNDTALNPNFISMTQLAGTTATTAAGILTDSGANFSSVVDNQDFLQIRSGTGVTAGKYLITGHTATTLTTSPALLNNATGDKSYIVTLGHNLNVGTNMQGIRFPVSFQAGLTTSFGDLGAVQRNPTTDYTDPGDANVKTGVTYLFSTVSKTGTYDGSDRWTDPGITNVRNGTAYKANSLTNNRTGTVVVPTAGQVKVGVTFEDASGTTGTYDGSDRWTDPGVANVRVATVYKANSTSNNRTGTLDLPSTSDVKIGVVYDATSETGTYDGSDRWTDPGQINVKSGVDYKANSLTNNKTGSYVATPLPQVLKNNLTQDVTNFLNGALWADRDSAIVTSGLGTASYTLYHPDGTTTGISQSGITNSSGLYFITPVDVSALVGVENYLLKITITIDSVAYATYVELPIVGATAVDLSPVQTVVDAIKLKTDNLPASPASTSDVTGSRDTVLTAVGAPLQTGDARLNHLDADISSVLTAVGDPLQTDDVRLNHLDADISSVLTAVGDPLQTDDVRLNHLDADISTVSTGGISAGDIADAVWDEAMSGHTTSGTYGLFVQKLLTVGKFLGLQ